MANFYGSSAKVLDPSKMGLPADKKYAGRVRAIYMYFLYGGTAVTTSDKIIFGQIPVGSVCIATLNKWTDMSDAGNATLTIKDGSGGTALTAALGVGAAAQSTAAFDYTCSFVEITNGVLTADVGTASIDKTAGAFYGLLFYLAW